MFLHDMWQNSTPYALAASAGLLSDRAGVINIALEGQMLAGALAGVVVSAWAGASLVGVLGAALVGMLMASALAFAHLHLRADIILAGLGINLLAAGGTVVFLFAATGQVTDATTYDSHSLSEISLPGMRDIPLLSSLSGQSIITYLAILSAPVGWWFLYRTALGTHIRAVGESPDAVIEAGLSPRRIRWRALLLCGLLCGLAGSQLSLDTTHTFVRDMTQGRGYIALGAIYLGARHPVGTFLAALVFGAFETLATSLQVSTDYPTELLLALPYVATIIALVIGSSRFQLRERVSRRVRNASIRA